MRVEWRAICACPMRQRPPSIPSPPKRFPPMSVHAIQHPLVQHKLGLMREAGTSTKSFRELGGEVTKLLTREATQDLELELQDIPGWSGEPIAVNQLKGKKVTIVPILRAGLGMLEGVTDLIPSARVSVVGLYRDEETLQP